MTTRTDGLHPEVPYAEYARWDARRASVLREGARSAAHLRLAALRVEDAPTEATELGVGVHAAILEPELFERRYAVPLQRGRRSKADQAAHAAFELEQAQRGREVLPARSYERALRMRDRVHALEWCRALLRGPGLVELCALWTDDTSGVRCKARIDRLALEYLGEGWPAPAPVIVDLKTSRDTSEAGWQSACASYGYALQARMQLEGLAAHDPAWLDPGTLEPRPEQYLWLVIEKEPPYEPRLFRPSVELLDAAGEQLRAALALWSRCEREDRWPGHGPRPRAVELTPWARRRMLAGVEDPEPERRRTRGERTRHVERDALEPVAGGDGAPAF